MANAKQNNDNGLLSRQITIDLLDDILHRRQPMDQAIAADKKFPALAPPDRGFVRLLLTTCLRRLGQIDAMWQSCLERPLSSDGRKVAHILRIAVAQLAFLKTPPHAAIHTSVDLCAKNNSPKFKPLVNAVLRRLQNEMDMHLSSHDETRVNTPDWLYHSWEKSYGADVASAIAAAHLNEPPLDISVKSNPELWAERLGAAILPNGSLRCTTGGMIEDRDGFGDGEWWIQDAAATIPARLLGDVANKQVIDLCAAPGGKTAQLLAMGAAVTAIDISAVRLKRLEQNLQRLKMTARVICADAKDWRAETPQHLILLDAPCSATGTIRKHPDIAWLKTPDDIARLHRTQCDILQNAVQSLAVGGILVYAVCSLEPMEGPDVIAKHLAVNPNMRRMPVTAGELPEFKDLISPIGDVRCLPCDLGDLGGMDGFYICRLQRAA